MAVVSGKKIAAQASLGLTDGDYTELQVNANGALYTTTTIVGTVPVSQSGAWTVAATQSGAWAVTATVAGTVSVSNFPAIQAVSQSGAWAVTATVTGTVSVSNFPAIQPVSGTVTANQGTSPWVVSGTVTVTDGSGPLTVDGTVTVNQGTSPWVVSGTVTSDTNFDYPEDSAHVSGDIGAFALGVRNDASAVRTSTDGDYSPLSVDSAGRTLVAGQIAQDSPVAGNPVGVGARASNTVPAAVSSDGDMIYLWADLNGRLKVHDDRTNLQGIYHANVGVFTVAASADAATAGKVWLVNTSSTVKAAIRYIAMTESLGSVTARNSFPSITIERVTFTGTPSGASVTPAKRDSTDAANTATIRTASTGMTLTAGAAAKSFEIGPSGGLSLSFAQIVVEQAVTWQEDERIVLRQNEGIVLRQASAGSTGDDRLYRLDIRWEEFI